MDAGGSECFIYHHPKKGKSSVHTLPPQSSSNNECPHTRVVCISDTHNQHTDLVLPMGDVLIHSGDVLTESGLRHVKTDVGGLVVAKDKGVQLVHHFAKWLGQQPHPFKVLVAGNHDKVLEAIGPQGVREIFDKYCSAGSFVYLEHQRAELSKCGFRVFGSPYGHWGSHNNAFDASTRGDLNWDVGPTHLFVTHSPPILPQRDGMQQEGSLVESVHRSKALLHVSGHCHWAYGLYSSKEKGTPFAVASICDSKWQRMTSLKGERVDKKWDLLRGGYNLYNRPIVCDLEVPQPSPGEDKWIYL